MTSVYVLKERKELTVNRVKVNRVRTVKLDMHLKFLKMETGLFGMLKPKSL